MDGGKTYEGAGAVAAMASDFKADLLTPQLLKPALAKVKPRRCGCEFRVSSGLAASRVFCSNARAPMLVRCGMSSQAVAAVLDAINAAVKAQPDAKKAEATLKAASAPKKAGGGQPQGKKQQQKGKQ